MSQDYQNEKEPIDPGLRRLYAHMTDDEVREAQRNLKRHVAVIVEIHDRLKAEGKEWPKPDSDGIISH